MDLLGSESSDADEPVSFKINENYARNYVKWRKKEERQKLIDKYGDVDSSDSSSEEGEIRSTPKMDKDWLRAYAVVRFQQPKLYKKGEKFFHDEAKPVVKHKEKATTLKDHERKFILEKGGVESDEDAKPQQPQGKSYFEEQEEIKKSFKEAVQDSSDDDDAAGESSGLLVKKQKTAEEQRKEKNEYLEWLKGERAELEDPEAAAELAPLKAYWNDPNLNEKEKVLRDYILNNGYMDQEESDEESKDDSGDDEIAPNFNDEEEFLEKAEEYEHIYNFRHEEPGGDEIKSYPRVIEMSVRAKDTRRADKRKKKLEKKNMERNKRKEEIRLLQKLQKEEKMEKLDTIRKIADRTDLEYDLNADFDPDEHNRIMKKFFNEDYYGDNKNAGEKPTFEYDAAIDDEPDDWWQTRLQEENQDTEDLHETSQKSSLEDKQMKQPCEEYHEDEQYEDNPNFIMDADYDPTRDYKSERKKSKKSRKVQKLPLFDPTTKTFDEYIDEYLKDKIDKLPFTYREVIPNNFGLSTEEILKANEKELNAWVSVKKMSMYRSKHDDLADKRKFLARSNNTEKKRKVLPSLYEKPGRALNDGEQKKKKKRKKKIFDGEITSQSSKSETQTGIVERTVASEEDLIPDGKSPKKLTAKTKKRKLSDVNNEDFDLKESVATNNTDLLSPRKKKKKKMNQESLNNGTEIDKTGSGLEELVPEVKVMKEQTNKPDISAKGVATNSGDSSFKIKKRKKKKKKMKQIKEAGGKQNNESTDGKTKAKKHKKKKLSISNFSSKPSAVKDSQTMDKNELKKKLSKVMSVSRLSKYGIGPNAVKNVKKKKKKAMQV